MVVVALLLLPFAPAFPDFQSDADVIRLRHLAHYSELIEEYRERQGHYPFAGRYPEIPTYVLIANQEQESSTNSKNPNEHRRIEDSEFFAELSTVLEREVEERYDPQYVARHRPNFYIYMVVRGEFFFAVHLNQELPFASKVGPHYNKVEVSSVPTDSNKALAIDTLQADPTFRKLVDTELPKQGFFDLRQTEHRFDSKRSDGAE